METEYKLTKNRLQTFGGELTKKLRAAIWKYFAQNLVFSKNLTIKDDIIRCLQIKCHSNQQKIQKLGIHINAMNTDNMSYQTPNQISFENQNQNKNNVTQPVQGM